MAGTLSGSLHHHPYHQLEHFPLVAKHIKKLQVGTLAEIVAVFIGTAVKARGKEVVVTPFGKQPLS